MPLPMLMPIMEDITAMVVMALAMAAMAVMALAMALVIMADGTAKDLLMLSPLPMLLPSPLPMLMPSPLPMLMPMPMLTHITEDTTEGEVTDSEVTEDTEDTMALVITADGTAKDRPMQNPKLMPMQRLMPITEVTTDMEVMEVTEDTEDIMVDIVDTTGDKNLV